MIWILLRETSSVLNAATCFGLVDVAGALEFEICRIKVAKLSPD